MHSLPGPITADRVLRGRTLLRRALAAVSGRELTAWPQLLLREILPSGLNLNWRGLLHDEPTVAAVRVAHALEMGAPGVHAWTASWPLAAESASLQLAASAAGFLAGRESLLILAATADGGPEDGALVDSESCARMAVAGFDPETEVRLGNCVELLASAGDLLNPAATGASGAAPARYLILGLKWHAPAGD